MASILDLLGTQKGEEFIAKASEATSESKENVTGVLGMALPILLGSMKNNINSSEGEKSLDNALNSEKHGDDFLTNLSNGNSSEMTAEGNKILDHILGDNQGNIVSVISNTLGIEKSSVSKIIKMAAPLLMSILSSQKKKTNTASSGLKDLLNSVMGASGKFDNSLIETILNGKGDGNILNDVKGMALGGGKSGKKDGGILGGMLGGK
ncbi:DUF937 domain-containing protein [Antarcticibacterium sp. 1MA-6-2]|uniref:DUF937 domain-containing protein n=1 Tax=Antarcticibacterium sp. 1MA-6-2 TaxID=2908210 RepID=UPI001F2B5BA1|nr:DUF937 domain-containing protein [Antarcticibacterium sp. 1MA-6-2]UJH91823.1 DUF937 domain-containing protein [Antarcticibacterium sp. 1MA-6-2]